MWLFQGFAILIAYPWVAFLLAAGFFVLSRASRRRVAGMAAVAWLLYGLYEYGMKLRILCSGECNIRVDLLLAYPILAILSLWAIVAALVRQRSRGGEREPEHAGTHSSRRIDR